MPSSGGSGTANSGMPIATSTQIFGERIGVQITERYNAYELVIASRPTLASALFEYSSIEWGVIFSCSDITYRLRHGAVYPWDRLRMRVRGNKCFKDVVTPYTHISEASRYILYTKILTFDGICTLSWSWVKMWSLNDMARLSTAQRKTARSEMTQYRDVLTGSRGKSRRSRRRFLFKQTQSQLSLGSQSDE